MICTRCNQPITGKPKPVAVDSGTGAGGTVFVCSTLCRRAPQQTYPTRRRGR